ncbi:hypothetical protein IFR05_012127 [Cadophora sp. M221]|nr:hypothetical protein IFR05_012127 [Cadophora sp. M221]
MSDRNRRDRGAYVAEPGRQNVNYGGDGGLPLTVESWYRRKEGWVSRSPLDPPDPNQTFSAVEVAYNIASTGHGEKDHPHTDYEEYEATSDYPGASTNYGDSVQGTHLENSTSGGYRERRRGSGRYSGSPSFQAEDIPEKLTPRKTSRRDHSLSAREWAAVSSSDQLSGSLAKSTIREGQEIQQDPTSSEQYDLLPREEVEKGHDTSYRGKGKDVERERPGDGATEDVPKLTVRGTPGDYEAYAAAYVWRTPADSKKFFRPGRVFFILWTEPYVDSMQSENDQFRSVTTYQVSYKQQKAPSKVRRFVVVKQAERHCTCLPVTTTFDGRGYKKRGIILDHHGLIYSSKEPPPHIEGITKAPLRIVLSNGADQIRNPTYINYGSVITVETNVMVKDIGALDSESRKLLRTHYKRVQMDNLTEDDDDFTALGRDHNTRLGGDVEFSRVGVGFGLDITQQPQYNSRGGYGRYNSGGYGQETGFNNDQGFPSPPRSLHPATANDPQSQSTYRYTNIPTSDIKRNHSGYPPPTMSYQAISNSRYDPLINSGGEHHLSQQMDQGWSGTSSSVNGRGKEGNYIPTWEDSQQQTIVESARTKYSGSVWGINQHHPRHEESDSLYVQGGPPSWTDFITSPQVPPSQSTHVDGIRRDPGVSYSGMQKGVSGGISTEDTSSTKRHIHGFPSGNTNEASVTFSSEHDLTPTQHVTVGSRTGANPTTILRAEQRPSNPEFLDSMAKIAPETDSSKSADRDTTLTLSSKEPALSRSCSVEDLESIFSRNESNSSRSSYTDEPHGAERLAELLLKDEELQDLYKVAAKKVTSERLRENFRRCLVQCSAHLKEEVANTKSAAGVRCARVLRHYSRNAAAQVALRMGEQKPIDAGEDSDHILDVGSKANFQDESDDEDEYEGAGDNDWQEAVQLEEILVSSEAFKLLKENFGLYLNPDPVKRALFRTWPVSHQRSNPLEIVYHAPWIIPSFLKSNFAEVQWHFEYKRSGHCRKPRKLFEVLKQPHLIKRYRTLDIEDLVRRRCFLGWADEVEVLIGTEAFSAKTIRWSEGDKAQGTGHLKSHGITTGTEGLGIFGVTANRTWLPVSVPSRITLQQNKDIADTLDDECDARTIVYDTGTKIAHLLPQADVTLFLAHKILKRRQLGLSDGNQATSLGFASPDVKAVDILQDSLDFKMVKSGRRGKIATKYFGDIVKEIWNALDMIENALVSNEAEWSTIDKGAPKFLHGVEFRDLESMKTSMTILQAKLNKPWVHLVISEPTIPVLFCQGLGQAIVPRNPKVLCRPWISVPHGENYMVATCMTICSWLDRHNNGEGSRLSERVEWNVDPRASREGLIYCHSTKKKSSVFHEQQLNFVRNATRNAKIFDLVMGHERGGLIFGSTRLRKGCSEKLDQSSGMHIRTTSLNLRSRVHLNQPDSLIQNPLKQPDSVIQQPPDVPEGSSDTSAETELRKNRGQEPKQMSSIRQNFTP